MTADMRSVVSEDIARSVPPGPGRPEIGPRSFPFGVPTSDGDGRVVVAGSVFDGRDLDHAAGDVAPGGEPVAEDGTPAAEFEPGAEDAVPVAEDAVVPSEPVPAYEPGTAFESGTAYEPVAEDMVPVAEDMVAVSEPVAEDAVPVAEDRGAGSAPVVDEPGPELVAAEPATGGWDAIPVPGVDAAEPAAAGLPAEIVADEAVAAEVAAQLNTVVGDDVEADPAEFAAAAVLDVLRASGWADAAEAAELRAEATRTTELLNMVVRDHRAREASAAGSVNQQLHWLVPLLRAAHGVAFGSLGAKVALRTAVQDVPEEVLLQAGLRIDYGVEHVVTDEERMAPPLS